MDTKEFTVHDRLGPVVVRGTLLADKRFGSDRKPRWTDLALYQIVETLRTWRVTARCQCSPPRILQTFPQTIEDAPILCGRCEKPFTVETDRREKVFRYALEVTARSWVYHRRDSACVKPRHKITTIAELKKSDGRWNNLFPCNRCKPFDIEDMNDTDEIAEERPDERIYLCTDGPDVVKRLYHHSSEISVLAARLLREAAVVDPEIERAITGSRRI